MEQYCYTKDLDIEVLDEAIKLRTSLRSVYIGSHIKINGDGSMPDDNVCIYFSRALISTEQDEITNLVNAIGPSYDLIIRKNIEKNTMVWAMSKGQEVLSQFAANNIYRQKTPAQITALVNNYASITTSLLTGSLTTAYQLFLQQQPDGNISQEEIDEFVLRLEIILGL
jgi:hypothetical protein